MTNDKGSTGYKYGSVNDDEEKSGAASSNNNFDESDLYFINDDELTKKEKAVKAFNTAVPVIIPVFFVGVLVYLLLHNFAFFYPGGGAQNIPSKHPMNSNSNPTKTTERTHHNNYTSSAPLPAKISFGSFCTANPQCAKMGLIGECCPTGNGVSLKCCS